MKKVLLIVAIVIAGFVSKAQQLPMYSQYMMNGFLLNPAMAGSFDYSPIRITARTQWTGIELAPQTFAISGHTLMNNKKVGLGGYIYSDDFGPATRTGIQGSFAYHLTVDRFNSKLSFGLSMSGYQYVLHEDLLNLIDDNDPSISYGKEVRFLPDATFGTYLYNSQYFVGFAATQLFEFKVDIGDGTTDENKMVRHMYLTAGYKFNLGEKMELEPSFLMKMAKSAPMQFDFNLKAYYQKNYWFGISYRTKDAAIAMLGVKVEQYYIGYAFDYSLSNIRSYNNGTHEIILGINLGEGATKGSSLL
ncbi:MAG TPA: hypothetical protein DDX39_02775 [Bacteroidales bacterium]|nr:MAG: hypothetical protein A2W98_05285 [Bacteroidetes bacterium GWF2_33_38]HBF87541.1 hypothetical protein [Bacteroidales bacterium]